MNIINNFCNWLPAINRMECLLLLFFSACIVYGIWSWKFFKSPKYFKLIGWVLFNLVSVVILLFSGLYVMVSFILDNDEIARVKYFPVNAAIKNTCYLDPDRKHCPKTLEEVIFIEDKNFSKLLNTGNATYKWYESDRTYTLIVKDEYSWAATIFDPKLKQAGWNDLMKVRLNSCGIPKGPVYDYGEGEAWNRYIQMRK